jgi:two-component system sensor histidine kinase/response regulator
VKRVLIVEDDPDLADVLRQALTDRLDVVADAVANGALVMDAVGGGPPDLLILDVNLPGLNGLDVFDLLRSDVRWQGVPVLFLTALPEQAATANAVTGVHEVLSKPFDIDELITHASRLLEGPTEVAA